MTGVAQLPLGLIDTHSLSNGVAMTVTGKGPGMTSATLAGGSLSRACTATVTWAVASGTAQSAMDLIRRSANKWRGRGAMTPHTVVCDWANCTVNLDGYGMIMDMTGKIGRMAEGAGA